MSKRKDFEYEGEFSKNESDSVKPQDNNLNSYNEHSDDIQPNVQPQTPNDHNDSSDNTIESQNNQDETPTNTDKGSQPVQNEIEDIDNNNNGDITPQSIQNENSPYTGDLDTDEESNLDEDNFNSDTSNQEDIDESDVGNENDENHQNEQDEQDKPKQDGENDSTNDRNSNVEQKDGDKKDHTLSDKLSDSDGGLGGIASKASGTLDAIQKAKKFKDIKDMSKKEAVSELYEITKGVVKDKVVAAIITFVAPYIMPIIAAALVIILLIVMIAGAVTSTMSPKSSDEKCTPLEENASSNIKLSKDAEKNAETIFKEVKSKVKGSTNKGVASLLGNIDKESAGTFSSKTIQSNNKYKESLAMDPSVGGYAFGFSQWDSGRRVNLIKFAEKQDKKWDDMDVQIDFLLNNDGSDSDLIKKLVKQDKDIKDTTEDIMNQWERAGDKDSLSDRQASASKYYAKFSGKGSDGSDDKGSNLEDATDAASDNSDAGENSECNTDSSSKTDGEIGASVKANGKSGKIIERWKSKKEIPSKYKKYISVPDFNEKEFLKDSMFAASSALRGQCTELTWGYMTAMWSGNQPTNGNGGDLHKSYKDAGAKVTSNPTVGYGFSSYPPYAGSGDSRTGHTGVVVGVMDDGKWILANYNLNLEAPDRVLTYALVDGNPKEGGTKFFSGVGKPKVKSKDK